MLCSKEFYILVKLIYIVNKNSIFNPQSSIKNLIFDLIYHWCQSKRAQFQTMLIVVVEMITPLSFHWNSKERGCEEHALKKGKPSVFASKPFCICHATFLLLRCLQPTSWF